MGEAASSSSIAVVGIGASAGGLEAVSELLAALPANTGSAFVLVQHLDRSHPSMLAEILGRRATMPVVEARDGVALAPGHLYVIPPNAVLTLSDDVLRLTARDGSRQNAGLIDTFFRSLAAGRGPAAVGVLLSGASSDGTRGAQEIKVAGGIVLAQDPESAAFPIMPRSAIDAGCVDFVASPADIAQRLTSLRFAPVIRGAAEATLHDEETWRRIFRLLRGASGIDFVHYKRSTIQRRVMRRLHLRRVADLAQYAALLGEDAAELNALGQDVLIGVTSFFRDPESFEALSSTVFPALLADREPRDPLRIWVPGCATGEELYSIAIDLMEHLGERGPHTPIQFFGTDASDSAIARARDATYPEGIESEIAPERLQRYFDKIDHHYRIAKSVRDMCVFARHDVTRDPPFSRLDLVSCRNLLIYFNAGLQRQVLGQFHYALKPQGFLLLGLAEAVGASTDLFEPADKTRRVFRRRDIPGRGPAHPPREPAPREPWTVAPPLRPATLEADRVQREADRMLIARYAPAAIVVDDDLNVHQFRGQTADYLEHASGAASLNLQQLAPPALLIALKPALREARAARTAVHSSARLETRGRTRNVSFEVSPFRVPDDAAACYLVVFEERRPRAGFWQRLLEAAARRRPPPGGTVAELEAVRRELAATRDFLKTNAEEQEAAKEELKSLHEEALSANEELQSTNEELETAKEELQSANEELATTNDELRTRNQQLHDANEALVAARDYAEAIVETVRHPLVVLDRRLRVQSANPAFYRLFEVTPADTEGRLLYDLGDRQWDVPDLRRLLEETLSRHEAVEDYVVAHAFERIGERTMLLNARRLGGIKGDEELILLGMEDATERLAAKRTLEDADRRKDEFLAMLGHELRNPLAPIRSSLDLIQHLDVRDGALRQCVDVIRRQTGQVERLVDDLLEMSRIARGSLRLDVAEITLGEVVTRAVETAQPLVEARRHRLSVAEPPQPLRVRGDLARLIQLVTNLLTNAAKYSPTGSEIRIGSHADGTDAILTVSDTGDGIAPERLARLFEAFQHRPEAATRTGLGIGLPLARRIAELHGGTMEAASGGTGKGSTFTLRLPLSPSPENLAAASGTTRALPKLHGCRVLVVDDNADAADSLQALLQLYGCAVRCAYDGASAAPLAAEFKPDIVFLDIALPDMDGYEVLRRLRADSGVTPRVVALTGYAQPGDFAHMRDAGFDRGLTKPVEGEALAALIAELRAPNK